MPNWSLAIGSNSIKIWCYVEWYRGAHNRFRGDNRRFCSQSAIGRVSLCVSVPLSRLKKISDLMVVVLRNILFSSTHMGVEEEYVFNWEYTDSYKEHDARTNVVKFSSYRR